MRDITARGNPALSPRVTDTRSWYRHAFVWLVLAILAWSVVAGLTLVYVAFSNADDVVSDTWYRDGRGINRDMAAERMAEALGIRVLLSGGAAQTQLQLHSDAALALPASLELALRHPTMASRDVALTFRLTQQGTYVADAPLPAGRYNLTLTPDAGHWRLSRQTVVPVDAGLSLDATDGSPQ
ncbi:FixH family protein [Isoalcanivorax indicus]|uniref:FixH family protein n=1 Tax=Isoalcanivorax indicus TaxID=2202653 RepID=UPI0013C41B9D|nr:FixH family protein [Isoalcanivorax indicus]